ncbi:hypothetical protein [Coleofasciculus sp.]|uniref:hypothetical protein n=1 Tax=Coleofasciculus sp. TaxID=3100458 RepID=UPI0039F7B5B2
MFDDIFSTINNESGWDETMAIDELATEGTLPPEMELSELESNWSESLDTDAANELATDTANQSENKSDEDVSLNTEVTDESATTITHQQDMESPEVESELSVGQETELTNQSASDSWQEPASKLPVEHLSNPESATSDRESPELWMSDELLNKLQELDSMEWYHHRTNWTPDEPFNGVGEPHLDAQFWQPQTDAASCAVVTQLEVCESLKGVKLPKDATCEFAEANGWYDPSTGTQQDALGKVLEAYGVETEQTYDATLVDIADALERGDKVIVALDGNEIWNPLRDASTGMPIEQVDAGHAVWVTGIHQSQDGSIKILLNDSLTTDGRMKVVDALDFLNAWRDFGNHLVIAQAPMK